MAIENKPTHTSPKPKNRTELRQQRKEIIRKKRSKQSTILMCLITLGIGGAISYQGYNLYKIYKSSESWEKSASTPLASLDPYMLYLSDEDVEELEHYTSSFSKIYNKDNGTFYKTATQKRIDDLTKEYNGLANSLKEKEADNYNLVMKMWKIKSAYDKLWVDDNHKVLKKGVTASNVNDFINTYWKDIDAILEDDSIKKDYLISIYKELGKLQEDTALLSSLVSIFDSTYTVGEKSIYVKEDVPSSNISEWATTKEKLSYNWPIITNYMNKIVSRSLDVLEKHDDRINLYNDVVKKQEEKEAYDNWVIKYNDYKNMLIDIPYFEGKDISELREWANKNNITLRITTVRTNSANEDTIISQEPTNNSYSKIIKGSTMNVSVAKKPESIKPSSSTSSSSSDKDEESSNRTESSTNSSASSSNVTQPSTSNNN